MNKRTIVLAFAATLIVAILAPSMASACTQPQPQPPQVWVKDHGTCCYADGTCIKLLWVTFHNFTTFPSNPGTFCACGLSKIKGIKTVRSAMVTDASTGEELSEFNFQANSGVSTSASRLLVGNDVQGFLARIGSDIPANRNVDLHFEVTVDADTDTDALVEALSNAGGSTLVTAEADEAGRFTGHLGRWPSAEFSEVPKP